MEKVFVSEVPDPPTGVWREITEVCEPSVVKTWQAHLKRTGLSETRVEITRDGHQLFARRK